MRTLSWLVVMVVATVALAEDTCLLPGVNGLPQGRPVHMASVPAIDLVPGVYVGEGMLFLFESGIAVVQDFQGELLLYDPNNTEYGVPIWVRAEGDCQWKRVDLQTDQAEEPVAGHRVGPKQGI